MTVTEGRPITFARGTAVLLGAVVASVVLNGCGGSSGSGSGCDSPCQSDRSEALGSGAAPAGSTDTSTATASGDDAYPDDRLTGFGAPVSRFTERHGPANPRLAAGCCFGPMVTNSDGSSVNEWNLATNLGPLVINLTHNFPADTTETTALSVVTRLDLPRDARQVTTVRKDSCKTFLYRSATLGKAAPSADLGATVSVTLYSPPDANDPNAPYTPSDVEQAIENSGDDSAIDC